MCDICRTHPCRPSCPNAPEPPAVATCTRCKGEVLVGEEFAVIDGDPYCESCLEDMPICELVTLFGGQWKKATEDDIDDGSDYEYDRRKESFVLGRK